MPQQNTSSESKIRLTAFFALVLIVAYLITGFGVFPLILLGDFALRAFNKAAYSPLGFLAGQVITLGDLAQHYRGVAAGRQREHQPHTVCLHVCR